MGTTKKLSGKTMGYVILIGLVIVSWVIFKILTPHNFGSFSNMLNYFQASLIATVGAVGFYFVMVMGNVRFLYWCKHHAFRNRWLRIGNKI